MRGVRSLALIMSFDESIGCERKTKRGREKKREPSDSKGRKGIGTSKKYSSYFVKALNEIKKIQKYNDELL